MTIGPRICDCLSTSLGLSVFGDSEQRFVFRLAAASIYRSQENDCEATSTGRRNTRSALNLRRNRNYIFVHHQTSPVDQKRPPRPRTKRETGGLGGQALSPQPFLLAFERHIAAYARRLPSPIAVPTRLHP